MSKASSRLGRFFVYTCLVAGSLLFGFPLIWMLVTSVMPIEQAMRYPPRMIPVAYYAELDGRRMEVTKDLEITRRSAFVEIVSGIRAGERTILPEDIYRADDPAVRLIRFVDPGWWQVTQRSATSKSIQKNLARDIVPPEAISTEVRPRWKNYPNALSSMGGRNLEEIEGSVEVIRRERTSEISFFRFLANTLIVCVLGVTGTVLSNAIIAYGFARLKWKGRDTFFALTLATMMIPFPVLMVPLYGVFKSLGWIGTLLPLWVPAFFGSAFNIFLIRQFFRTIPEELSEAARIDGCGEWRIFWRIIMPLSRPVLAVCALFHFLWSWNDFLGPLLFLTKKETFTLAIALQSYQTQHGGVQWNYLMAASAVTVIPIIILFFFAQKTFIQGIATTGSKS